MNKREAAKGIVVQSFRPLVDFVVFHLAMQTIRHDIAILDKKEMQEIEEALNKGMPRSEIDSIHSDFNDDRIILEHQMALEKSWRLVRIANSYDVEVPDRLSQLYWEKSSVLGMKFLTQKGISFIRAEIRNEKNEKWKVFEIKFKVFASVIPILIGLIGALIGLFSIGK